MNSLSTRYSMFFNKKYRRVGGLCQDVYKAVRVLTDEQLLELTRYIHRNPIFLAKPLSSYPYSSYGNYLNFRNNEWLYPKNILDYFSKSGANSYQYFVEYDEQNLMLIAESAIDIEEE